MLFNSIDFAIFLPVVFVIYWFITGKNLKIQNLFVVAASYFFYGWWDWRFLSLIAFSSAVDYFVGLGLLKYKERNRRKLLLLTSIFVNLGFLGFFNTIIFSWTTLFRRFHYSDAKSVLVLSISFYLLVSAFILSRHSVIQLMYIGVRWNRLEI